MFTLWLTRIIRFRQKPYSNFTSLSHHGKFSLFVVPQWMLLELWADNSNYLEGALRKIINSYSFIVPTYIYTIYCSQLLKKRYTLYILHAIVYTPTVLQIRCIAVLCLKSYAKLCDLHPWAVSMCLLVISRACLQRRIQTLCKYTALTNYNIRRWSKDSVMYTTRVTLSDVYIQLPWMVSLNIIYTLYLTKKVACHSMMWMTL